MPSTRKPTIQYALKYYIGLSHFHLLHIMGKNDDMTYCNGKGCLLKDTCIRYLEGQNVDKNFNWWMENCDPETREGYWSDK